MVHYGMLYSWQRMLYQPHNTWIKFTFHSSFTIQNWATSFENKHHSFWIRFLPILLFKIKHGPQSNLLCEMSQQPTPPNLHLSSSLHPSPQSLMHLSLSFPHLFIVLLNYSLYCISDNIISCQDQSAKTVSCPVNLSFIHLHIFLTCLCWLILTYLAHQCDIIMLRWLTVATRIITAVISINLTNVAALL